MEGEAKQDEGCQKFRRNKCVNTDDKLLMVTDEKRNGEVLANSLGRRRSLIHMKKGKVATFRWETKQVVKFWTWEQ
ncbi:unnamed protein product [Prunus armeniaca]